MAAKPTLRTGVYVIENLVNGRRYVGSAMRLPNRWNDHRRSLERGNHHSRFLQREWKKRGSEAFTFRVALYCAPADLLFYEQLLIDFYKPEYNSAPRAGSQLGYRHTAEAKAKMAASNSRLGNPGFKHNADSRKRSGEANIGLKHHPEAVAKRMASIVARHGRHKGGKPQLTEYDVRLIRERVSLGEKQVYFANFYRLSSGAISEIVSRKTYAWVI